MYLVYMVIRTDDLCYIGATVNLQKRLHYHINSRRFEMGIKDVKVLFQTLDYNECLLKEEYYIMVYDTFNNGLNKTYNGKGKSGSKFTTFNFKFSDQSKKKMSESRKNFFNSSTKRWSNCLSEEKINIIKNKMKNKITGPVKLNDEIKAEILRIYNLTPLIPLDYIKTKVKDSQSNLCETLEFSELKSKNGKQLNYIKLFIDIYCSDLMSTYSITSSCIYNFITRKSWNGTTLYK